MVSPKNLRSVQRIISLPITRPRNASAVLPGLGHKNAFTFYQFQVNLPQIKREEPSQPRWKPKGGWIHWAHEKASNTWAGFGKAPEGNWKLKVFRIGERLVDRLDYEELALKGVDPSMGPTILHLDIRGKGVEETDENKKVINSSNVAYRASQYLAALIKHGHVVSAPSLELDALYKKYTPKSLTSTSTRPAPLSHQPSSPHASSHSETENIELLLTRDAVPDIVSTFSLEESSASDMYRAIEQARIRTKTSTT
ncbi:hypothetical protein HHX47_DHR4000418 [Lentinula edodes]|nr:hypothetical protein HHX47_DHR4000418 [Lentinula edodes]